MTDSHEIAWASGLFDGEGSVFAATSIKKGRRQVRLHMLVRMTTLDDVERFHKAIGFGAVTGPYKPPGNRKLIWAWQAGCDENVRACIYLLWAYLGSAKRQNATAAIAARDKHIANPEPKKSRQKDYCKRGHELRLHRRTSACGTSWCVLCQRITYVAWRDRRKLIVHDAPLFAEVAAE